MEKMTENNVARLLKTVNEALQKRLTGLKQAVERIGSEEDEATYDLGMEKQFEHVQEKLSEF